jgi:hypothetical protein
MCLNNREPAAPFPSFRLRHEPGQIDQGIILPTGKCPLFLDFLKVCRE